MSHRGRLGGAKRPKLDERARWRTASTTEHNVRRPRRPRFFFTRAVSAAVRAFNLERMARSAERRKAAARAIAAAFPEVDAS